jgi:hypothetical protein
MAVSRFVLDIGNPHFHCKMELQEEFVVFHWVSHRGGQVSAHGRTFSLCCRVLETQLFSLPPAWLFCKLSTNAIGIHNMSAKFVFERDCIRSMIQINGNSLHKLPSL